MIVEVLSASTGRVDRREKLLAYATLPSLQEYLLVSQERREVQVHRRILVGWSNDSQVEKLAGEQIETPPAFAAAASPIQGTAILLPPGERVHLRFLRVIPWPPGQFGVEVTLAVTAVGEDGHTLFTDALATAPGTLRVVAPRRCPAVPGGWVSGVSRTGKACPSSRPVRLIVPVGEHRPTPPVAVRPARGYWSPGSSGSGTTG